MTYRQFIRTPFLSQKNINQKFSFLDNFGNECEEKTLTNSQTKNTEADTCCGISLEHHEHENNDQLQFYSETQTDIQQKHLFNDGANIKKQIVYRSAEDYRIKLQNLLSQINISGRNKIFLRLLIVDKQFEKDRKLEEYFQWALGQYKKINEKQIQIWQLNSLDQNLQPY